MSTITPDIAPDQHPRAATRTLAGTFLTLVATLALVLGFSTPSFAATGAQTGEWDIVAASQGKSPALQSYNHDSTPSAWDVVAPTTASFAVGNGKVIDGNDLTATTPVKGGGIRFENTAATAKTATFTFTVPANVGLKIQTLGGGTVVNTPATSAARTVSWTTPTVASGVSFHEHFTWTFSGSGTATAANIGVKVGFASPGSAIDSSTSAAYRFTF
ncbi:hypothetical protein GCM10023346_28110 [Arthrobacter gyeryongensis]|uniref:Uncharacterized protein n=1 Tax=Arthrobacter gyeryongensis TaxID=1650592 RepID=A0ABP9SIX6_9MICC